MKHIDVQDILLLAGVASLCTGVGVVYWPAAVILFGIICLILVLLIERSKQIPLSDKDKAWESAKGKKQ